MCGALDKLWKAYRPNVAAVEKKFPSKGNGRNVQQLIKFQQTFANVGQMRDLETLNPEETFQKIAARFNWKLPGLFEKMENCRYFKGLVKTHKRVLKAMSAKTAAVDPRPGLQRLMPDTGSNKSLKPVYAHLCAMFGIKALPPVVKDFFEVLRRGDLASGPLTFTAWETLSNHCQYYRELFKFKLKDRFFPAFQIAYEDSGVEFWMMAESGKIIDFHHDASFYERADEIWDTHGPDVSAFEDEFSFRNHQLTIAQLMRLQQAFPNVKKMSELEDLDPEKTFRKIADSFGWSMTDLSEGIGQMEYFFPLYDSHKHVLDEMERQEQEAER